MKLVSTLAAGLAVVLFSAVAVQAADVTISGVHLCCGACVKGVGKALDGVAGVSNVSCDQDSETVKFTAADDKAATAGVAALAKAGFGGKAKSGDKEVAFPASGVEKGKKANSVSISGIHLCCGGCYKAAEGSLKGVAGVKEVKSDKATKTITLSGEGIDINAALDALSAGGFHGTAK